MSYSTISNIQPLNPGSVNLLLNQKIEYLNSGFQQPSSVPSLTNITGGAHTYTAAELLNRYTIRSALTSNPVTDTLPTASQIVTALNNYQTNYQHSYLTRATPINIGFYFDWTVVNSDSTDVLKIDGSTGITILYGTQFTVSPSSYSVFRVTVTNITTPTVSVCAISSGPSGGGGSIPLGTSWADYLYWDPYTAGGQWTVGSSNVKIGSLSGQTSQGSNSVAIGLSAGSSTQGSNSVAVGVNAGQQTQGANAVAIGGGAGQTNQGSISVAIGSLAAQSTQGGSSIAIGFSAGQTAQGANSIAIGSKAGATTQGNTTVSIGFYGGAPGPQNNQGTSAVSIGRQAGTSTQGSNAVAVGNEAGSTYQGSNAVAVGCNAGQQTQGASSVAVGTASGQSNQGINAVAIGLNSGQSNQATSAIAIGANAGQVTQSSNAVAIGSNAGRSNQGTNAIAIGIQAGVLTQGSNCIAIGSNAGSNGQTSGSIAIGGSSGITGQGTNAIAIGMFSGCNVQGSGTVAVGYLCGRDSQGTNAIAIGSTTGQTSQGQNCIAIGNLAGSAGQGTGSIAIGRLAGQTNQAANSIVICASGTAVNGTTASATYIAPIRNVTFTNVLGYDTTNFEVVYSAKTFVIDHPKDDSKYLVHSCLEGPEAGVYYRGTCSITNEEYVEVELPDYVEKLATNLTAQITPVYSPGRDKHSTYYVTKIEGNKFKVYGCNGEVNWVVYGRRQSIETEPSKDLYELRGDGPYTYLQKK